MTPKQQVQHITKWIKSYAKKHKIENLVVGISGGIDSSVVSALCAKTGISTIAVSMPIRQRPEQHDLSVRHGRWLQEEYSNVTHVTIDLTATFNAFAENFRVLPNELALANSRSRLRMTCLYQIAQSHGGIVVGTGNKVEDFGVGFYTKYGDGGVDISPIGDCMKTEVWAMGEFLGVDPDIVAAAPTDGLWEDGRTDEDQLGMTYPELEQAMTLDLLHDDEIEIKSLNKTQRSQLNSYRKIRARSLHKMLPIPVCMMPTESSAEGEPKK